MYTIVKTLTVQFWTPVVESDHGNEVDLQIEGGPASRGNDLQALSSKVLVQPSEPKAMVRIPILPRRGRKVNGISGTALIFSLGGGL